MRNNSFIIFLLTVTLTVFMAGCDGSGASDGGHKADELGGSDPSPSAAGTGQPAAGEVQEEIAGAEDSVGSAEEEAELIIDDGLVFADLDEGDTTDMAGVDLGGDNGDSWDELVDDDPVMMVGINPEPVSSVLCALGLGALGLSMGRRRR